MSSNPARKSVSAYWSSTRKSAELLSRFAARKSPLRPALRPCPPSSPPKRRSVPSSAAVSIFSVHLATLGVVPSIQIKTGGNPWDNAPTAAATPRSTIKNFALPADRKKPASRSPAATAAPPNQPAVQVTRNERSRVGTAHHLRKGGPCPPCRSVQPLHANILVMNHALGI